MTFCSTCGTQIAGNAPFCSGCGNPTASGGAGNAPPALHPVAQTVAPPNPGKPVYTRYDQIPFFRKQWFFWATYLIFTPIALIVLLSGPVYYEKKGEIKTFGLINKIIALLIGLGMIGAALGIA